MWKVQGRIEEKQEKTEIKNSVRITEQKEHPQDDRSLSKAKRTPACAMQAVIVTFGRALSSDGTHREGLGHRG